MLKGLKTVCDIQSYDIVDEHFEFTCGGYEFDGRKRHIDRYEKILFEWDRSFVHWTEC